MRAEQLAIGVLRTLVRHPRLGNAVFRLDKWGNIVSPERFSDPYPIYERMHRVGAVSYSPFFAQWAVTGYDEARDVLGSRSFGVAAQLETLLSVRPYSRFSDRTKELLSHTLLFTDPPQHTRLRALVSRAFTPRQVARLEPRVDQLARDLLAGLDDDACPDLIGGFAHPLAINVISDLLGVPETHWEHANEMSTRLRDIADPFTRIDVAAVDANCDEIASFYGRLADERLAEPRDDLISELVAAEVEGKRLTRPELLSVVALLMLAGHETTTGLIGNSIVALARFPDQRQMVRDDPGLWPNAIEELIRFDTPLQTDPRTALDDVEVGGVTIRKGQNLTVMMGAANHDPRRFDEAGELRLDRVDPSPISFGHGIHHCIGAALARMEAKAALRAVVDAFGDYTVDPRGVVWKQSLALRGPAFLPVRRPGGDAVSR